MRGAKKVKAFSKKSGIAIVRDMNGKVSVAFSSRSSNNKISKIKKGGTVFVNISENGKDYIK